MLYIITKTVAYIFALVIDASWSFIKSPLIPVHFNTRHLFSRNLIPCPLMIFWQSSTILTPISTRTSSRKPALGNVLLPCPCPASLSPRLHPYQRPTPLPVLTATTTTLWYLEPTRTPLRRRQALLWWKPQRPPPLLRRHWRLPRGGVPAEAVASPRLLDWNMLELALLWLDARVFNTALSDSTGKYIPKHPCTYGPRNFLCQYMLVRTILRFLVSPCRQKRTYWDVPVHTAVYCHIPGVQDSRWFQTSSKRKYIHGIYLV